MKGGRASGSMLPLLSSPCLARPFEAMMVGNVFQRGQKQMHQNIWAICAIGILACAQSELQTSFFDSLAAKASRLKPLLRAACVKNRLRPTLGGQPDPLSGRRARRALRREPADLATRGGAEFLHQLADATCERAMRHIELELDRLVVESGCQQPQQRGAVPAPGRCVG